MVLVFTFEIRCLGDRIGESTTCVGIVACGGRCVYLNEVYGVWDDVWVSGVNFPGFVTVCDEM